MLELLEILPDSFCRAFNKVVKETELTVFSVQTNSREALVLTNRKLYYLKRRPLLGVTVKNMGLKDVTKITPTPNCLEISARGGMSFRVSFSPEKSYLFLGVVEKLSRFKEQNQ